MSVPEAVRRLDHSTASAKCELLTRNGITFDKVPAWQCRGVGIYWETYEKEGYDPVARRPVLARRRRATANMELPIGEAYDTLLRQILHAAGKSAS